MVKYKSNTYYLLDNLPFRIVLCAVFFILTYNVRDNINLLIPGVFLTTIFVFAIILRLRKIARVEFNESHILFVYFFPRLEKRISYTSIKEYHYIRGFQLTSLNIIKYHESGTSNQKTLKLTNVVNNNEFIDFAKWIKKKNHDIKFKFFPSDSELIDEYKKAFDYIE